MHSLLTIIIINKGSFMDTTNLTHHDQVTIDNVRKLRESVLCRRLPGLFPRH